MVFSSSINRSVPDSTCTPRHHGLRHASRDATPVRPQFWHQHPKHHQAVQPNQPRFRRLHRSRPPCLVAVSLEPPAPRLARPRARGHLPNPRRLAAPHQLPRLGPLRQRCLQRHRHLCLDANRYAPLPPSLPPLLSPLPPSPPPHHPPKLTTPLPTGNTIFLALGAASLPPNQPLLWLRALVSISSFWAGCLFFSRAFKTHHPRPLQKLTLALSFALQALLVVAAAILAQTSAVPAFAQARLPPTIDDAAEHLRFERENDAVTLAPLALLAFGFGGQIVASRVLGFTEVPTNVLTSLYCDLLSDPGLVKAVGKNEKRDRRVVAIVMMLGGGVVGGWMQRTGAGMSGALWLAAGIKLVLAGAWLGWKSKEVPAVEGGKGDV